MKKVLLSSVAALAIFAAATPVLRNVNLVTQKKHLHKVLMFKLILMTRTQKDMQLAQFQKFV